MCENIINNIKIKIILWKIDDSKILAKYSNFIENIDLKTYLKKLELEAFTENYAKVIEEKKNIVFVKDNKLIELSYVDENTFIEYHYNNSLHFLPKINHQIRCELTNILGTIILNIDENEEDDKRNELANEIIEYCNNLNDIVDKISLIIDITNNKINIKQSYFILGPYLNKIINTNFKNADIKIINNINDAFICTDKNLLEIILLHIINNGIKYSNNNKINIAIEFSNSHIIFTIKDFGYGINNELEKQINNLLKYDININEMAGFGLFIAHNLSKLLEGNIKFETNINEGSVFTIKIKNYLE